jgi:hypothetical protein
VGQSGPMAVVVMVGILMVTKSGAGYCPCKPLCLKASPTESAATVVVACLKI